MVTAQFPHALDKVEFWQIHDLDRATPGESLQLFERLSLRSS
jgi:hypothetical protein